LNEDIRDKEVRLIGDDGEQLGVVSGREAYELAIEKKLDLVKISPQAKPPVCKIMDYGKFKYDQQKREKDSKKKQKQIQVKEVRLSVKIDKHDLETNANRAIKFLEAGDKVKVALRFKGREMANISVGYTVINRFIDLIGEAGALEMRAKMEGRSMVAFLNPTKTK